MYLRRNARLDAKFDAEGGYMILLLRRNLSIGDQSDHLKKKKKTYCVQYVHHLSMVMIIFNLTIKKIGI